MVNFHIFTPDFHIIVLLLVGPELVAHWLHPVHNEFLCSVLWFGCCLFTLVGSAAVVVHVSIIPCCTLSWQRRCLQCFQPWECRLVSWHVAAYLASPSLSLSFEMKEEAVPWAIFTDCSFTPKLYTHWCVGHIGWWRWWWYPCLLPGSVSRVAAD